LEIGHSTPRRGTLKSILLPVHRDPGFEARFQAAMDLARAFDGHLTCLQVVPLESYSALEPYGVSYMLAEPIEQLRALQEKERQSVELDLGNEGIPWDWLTVTGSPARMIAEHSWLKDLIVMSAPEEDWQKKADTLPVAADVVVKTRSPVLVVPDSCNGIRCDGTIAIAWNGSPEACAAIRACLPVLAKAAKVVLLSVKEEGGYDLPSLDASEYLSRHGISSRLAELEHGPGPVSETLLEAAEDIGANCLVMGAYGHSRLRENIFGGVTRGMLNKADLPVLMAH
jgi:nucleotide-binding universal stress UspA family protein